MQVKRNYMYNAAQFFLVVATPLLLCGCASLKGKNYLAQGNYYLSQENFKEAAGRYKKAIQSDSEKPAYLAALGWAYFKLGNYDQAIETFARLEERDAASLDAYTGRGWCNFKKSDFEEAIKYFRKALYIDANSAEAFAGLGWCSFRKQDTEEAKKYFNLALSKGLRYQKGVALKTEPEAHRGLGYLKFSQGDFKTSLRHFKIATELMPGWNDARMKWADCLFSLAKYPDAIRVYRYALKHGKSIEAYDKLGWSYLYLGQKTSSRAKRSGYYKTAKAKFNRALGIDPAYASSLSGLAEIEKASATK